MPKINFKILTISLFVILLVACNKPQDPTFCIENDPIFYTNNIITLDAEKTFINLNDFIINLDGIDSAYFTGGEYIYNKQKHTINITEEYNHIKVLSSINIVKNKNTYSLICRKRKKNKIEIKYNPHEGQNPDSVKIAGDFNSWNPEMLIMNSEGGIWTASVSLDLGIYQYQIVVDDVWQNNYPEGDTVANGIGGYNTLLSVKDKCQSLGFSISTVSCSENSITIESSYIPESLIILWQNQIIPINLNNFNGQRYTFKVPSEAKSVKRSYIKIYASYEDCFANNLLIPLHFGKVVKNTSDLSRQDKHFNIIYFVLVDRFFNGDVSNDKIVKDARVDKKSNYQGGDIAGISECIDNEYFKKLGINCLWISPVFQNPLKAYQEYPEPHRYFSGYHGYWPISSVDVDSRFGDKTNFKSMVEKAHTQNMNVILDFVANHVHEDNPLYQENKNWATQLNLPDGRINIRIWGDQRLTSWFDTFLPAWDFENPEVTDTISNIAMYWLKEYNLDGFRHDATKHIPLIFWKTLTKKIRKEFPDKSILQIGETFGNRELIASYVGTGMLDGQFDFNLYFDARNCFSDSSCNMLSLAESLIASLEVYGYNNLMGNITGNHDLTRFITYADKSILPGEDDKEAGWSREITVKNASSYKKLQSLAAFIISIPGIPCIYYGDEIGMPGAGDPDNRRKMQFDGLKIEQTETIDVFSKLIAIRKKHIEFIYGSTSIIEAGTNSMIIERQYFDNRSYIIFNHSVDTLGINLSKKEINNINNYSTNFNSKINELSSNYQILIKPYSFEILTKEE
jgi:glycosidase